MSMVRVDIETIVIGKGSVASLIVLRPRSSEHEHLEPLPIRVGTVEASAIGMGLEPSAAERPMTHDLMRSLISQLEGTVRSVSIVGVKGTTFYARINITVRDGQTIRVDARPSDALALAVRTKAPIFVDTDVMKIASYPDFDAVKRDEQEQSLANFDSFVESLNPDDFTS